MIVLLSDGKNTLGQRRDPLEVAREAQAAQDPDLRDRARHAERRGRAARLVRLRSSASSVPPDTETLREIARITGGRYFAATETPTSSRTIYANLGTRLSSRAEKREVTAAFAGGAIVLLLAGGALSLAWFGRPLCDG